MATNDPTGRHTAGTTDDPTTTTSRWRLTYFQHGGVLHLLDADDPEAPVDYVGRLARCDDCFGFREGWP